MNTVQTTTDTAKRTPIPLPVPAQKKSLKQAITIGCICALTVASGISGCSKSIKPESHEPSKLVQLAQNPSVVTPVFAASLSGQSKLAAVDRFEVGFDGTQVVAASSGGQVAGFNLQGESLWSLNLGDAIVGGVSFDGGSQTAVVTTKSAQAVAIDTKRGTVKWQAKLSGTVLAPALIHNNRVILVGNDGAVHGLSLQTGESIWQFVTQTPSISVRGGAKPTLLDATTALIATADGRLHAVDIETGIPKWSRRVGVPTGASEIQRMTDVDGAPVVDNEQLFAVSYSGQLIGVDLSRGQILFLQEAASKNSLAVVGNAVITTTLDGLVKAYDRQTGDLLWENNALAYRELSNPVVIGDYIAIGDLEGVVHLLSPLDGHIVSRVQSKGRINQLQAQAGYLLTQTQSGQVNVWRLAR